MLQLVRLFLTSNLSHALLVLLTFVVLRWWLSLRFAGTGCLIAVPVVIRSLHMMLRLMTWSLANGANYSTCSVPSHKVIILPSRLCCLPRAVVHEVVIGGMAVAAGDRRAFLLVRIDRATSMIGLFRLRDYFIIQGHQLV